MSSEFTDAFDEITQNHTGIYEEDVDNWETKECWTFKEKEEFNYCVGEKEQLNLSTKTVKILADLRDRKGR